MVGKRLTGEDEIAHKIAHAETLFDKDGFQVNSVRIPGLDDGEVRMACNLIPPKYQLIVEGNLVQKGNGESTRYDLIISIR